MANNNKQEILKIARSFIGTPYKYAAKPEEIPQFLDCSSFTQYVYKQIGISMPRSTLLQATQGKKIKSVKEAQTGDLLFFRGSKGHYDDKLFHGKKIYIGHVAMVTENKNAVHGASKKEMVTEEPIKNIIRYAGKIIMIKRML